MKPYGGDEAIADVIDQWPSILEWCERRDDGATGTRLGQYLACRP